MPLHIKDDFTAGLDTQPAFSNGVTRQKAIRTALRAELDRVNATLPRRFAALRAAFRPPLPTGLAADKAFFDELSGEDP